MKTIKELLKIQTNVEDADIFGWVKTKRESKNLTFIMLNDGSCINNLQIVIDHNIVDKTLLDKINTGASINVKGNLIIGEHGTELKTKEIVILSQAIDFPIQPKKHSMEFLRDLSHLRIRTTTFQSVFRVRNAISFAIHKFFQENNFIYVNTPIITASDAEGAGDMFTVTTLGNDKKDYKDDFFGQHTNLTVSGQLEGETTIFGFNKVYTFGPTFRAENSNTTRHLAEFWMIEPEMAFFDLKDNMALAERFLKYVYRYVKENCHDELLFLDERYKNEKEESLIDKLEFAFENEFKIVTYTDAIKILKNCDANKNGNFSFKIEEWGCDLQTEHERYLTEKYFKAPTIVINYPADIKAFYMKMNDDNKTVAAMDILLPGIGEIIGGSQREENLDLLIKMMKKKGVTEKTMQWYLDTRRYGSVVHSGFGLGLERLVQFITGMDNIRDVILYPRTPGRIVP